MLTIVIGGHLEVGPIKDCELKVRGCESCIIECIATLLAQNPRFKDLINKSIRLANERKAQKEN